MTATGWGLYKCSNPGLDCPNGKRATVLQELDLPVVGAAACTKDDSTTTDSKKDNKICFGGVAGKGVCQGDSGSPIVYNNNGK